MSESEKKTQKFFSEPEHNDDLSSPRQRQIIGYIGALLPLLLWLIAGLRPIEEQSWAPLSSISAYYYTGAVSIFSGMLFILALHLVTYQGFRNTHGREQFSAGLAALAAVMITLFPTAAPGDITPPPWWTPLTGGVHVFFATLLFLCFIFFALFQFPRSDVKNFQDLPPDKKRRNAIYIACGLLMSACIISAGIALFNKTSIFVQEALALELFAISWLVKGRIDKTAAAVGSMAADAGKKTMDYARHPRKLVKEVRDAVRNQQGTGPTSPLSGA